MQVIIKIQKTPSFHVIRTGEKYFDPVLMPQSIKKK